ncbi:MAG: hypothetical protein AB7T01_10950 [Acidithiobacillus sp.]
MRPANRLAVGSPADCLAAPLDLLWQDPFDTQEHTLPLGKTWTGVPSRLPQASLPAAKPIREPQSLAALTAYALAHNPQTQVAWENLQASTAGVGAADAAFLPSLSLSALAAPGHDFADL